MSNSLGSLHSHVASNGDCFQNRLYWSQAEYHQLCVGHDLPPSEDIATIVVKEKTPDEKESLCLALLALLRSTFDGLAGRNPYLPADCQQSWSSMSSTPTGELSDSQGNVTPRHRSSMHLDRGVAVSLGVQLDDSAAQQVTAPLNNKVALVAN